MGSWLYFYLYTKSLFQIWDPFREKGPIVIFLVHVTLAYGLIKNSVPSNSMTDTPILRVRSNAQHYVSHILGNCIPCHVS